MLLRMSWSIASGIGCWPSCQGQRWWGVGDVVLYQRLWYKGDLSYQGQGVGQDFEIWCLHLEHFPEDPSEPPTYAREWCFPHPLWLVAENTKDHTVMAAKICMPGKGFELPKNTTGGSLGSPWPLLPSLGVSSLIITSCSLLTLVTSTLIMIGLSSFMGWIWIWDPLFLLKSANRYKLTIGCLDSLLWLVISVAVKEWDMFLSCWSLLGRFWI